MTVQYRKHVGIDCLLCAYQNTIFDIETRTTALNQLPKDKIDNSHLDVYYY